jgi:hypothetical protein
MVVNPNVRFRARYIRDINVSDISHTTSLPADGRTAFKRIQSIISTYLEEALLEKIQTRDRRVFFVSVAHSSFRSIPTV